MSKLGTLLRAQREAIMAEWLRRVRERPEAEHLPEPVLRDNLPQILDEISECFDKLDCQPSLDALPTIHALERYRIGFDVRDVVAEYRILRQVILSMIPSDAVREETAFLHDMLDRAISDAVDHFAFERDRAREVFVGMLGHDLRGPLNAISMAAQHMQLQAERLDPSHARLLKRILGSVSRIDRMADDMLDFTRGRIGGGVPIKVAPVDLAVVIRDVTDEFNEAFPDRKVEAKVPSKGLDGEWDSDRLSQVVSNLIANALEHGADPVEIGARPVGEQVVIEVHNRGELAPELLGRVFDPFVSLAPTKAGRRGLGLGLYIVREVAKAHGGSVEASSREGMTTFRVLLPRVARPAQQ